MQAVVPMGTGKAVGALTYLHVILKGQAVLGISQSDLLGSGEIVNKNG